MAKGSIYLGNSLVLSRNKSKEFKVLKDKITTRLNEWSRNLLSKAGKVTMIKLVLQATPVYTMSTFRVPSGICKEMVGIVRRFRWETSPNKGNFLALKAWDKICKPKREGGLGFQRFKDINSALLAKLAWKLEVRDKKLWTEVLSSKYLKGKSFFEHFKPKGASYSWQGIISSRNFLKKGCCYRIGNGLKTNLWKDPWILELPNRIPIIKEGANTNGLSKVIDLKETDGIGWKEEIFLDEIARCILQMAWPTELAEDKFLWCGNPKGIFSVSNCFELNRCSISRNNAIWNKLWKARVHERLKVFGWRALANVLPTKEVLSMRMDIGDSTCNACGAIVESTFHIFKDCPASRAITFSSLRGAKIDGWPGENLKYLISFYLNPPHFLWEGFL